MTSYELIWHCVMAAVGYSVWLSESYSPSTKPLDSQEMYNLSPTSDFGARYTNFLASEIRFRQQTVISLRTPFCFLSGFVDASGNKLPFS